MKGKMAGKLKIVFSVVTLLGIVGLTSTGTLEVGGLVQIGVGIGTMIAAVAALFTKKE